MNCFRGGNSSTSSTGSISGVYAASTRNIYGFHNLENLSTPSISDVCTASTACTRGSVLLIILPYSQHLGLQYSYCSYSQYVQYLGHHLREYCNTLSTSSTQSIEPRNTVSTDRIGKKKYRTPHIRTYCTTQQHHAPTHLPSVVVTLVSGVQQ